MKGMMAKETDDFEARMAPPAQAGQRVGRCAKRRSGETNGRDDGGPRKRRPFAGKKCSTCGHANGTRARRCASCEEPFPENALQRPKAKKRPPAFEPQVDDDGTHVVEFVASKPIDATGVDVNAAGTFARLYGARTKSGSRITVDWISAERHASADFD